MDYCINIEMRDELVHEEWTPHQISRESYVKYY